MIIWMTQRPRADRAKPVHSSIVWTGHVAAPGDRLPGTKRTRRLLHHQVMERRRVLRTGELVKDEAQDGHVGHGIVVEEGG